MAVSEWLRTFVAIYRSGSVSGGASQRNLSQPAASQQLASLERRIGLPLFVRDPHGVEPTRRGRELHAQVAESLDRLEPVLAGIDGGTATSEPPAIRFGSSAEFFSYAVVPQMEAGVAGRCRPGSDRTARLLDLLEHGELDIAVTSVTPAGRSLTSTPIGTKRFVLVGRADAGARIRPSTHSPSSDRGWSASPGWPSVPSCP